MNAAALMNKPHMFLLSFMSNAIVGSRLSLIILLEFVHANIPSFVCVWGRIFSLLN
jgi:hypothetical protein